MARTFLYNVNGKLRLPIVIIGSFCVAFFGFIPGMGLPGGIMLAVALVILLPVTPWLPALPDYAVWGAAILLTWSLFPFLILAYVVAFRFCAMKTKQKQRIIWLKLFVAWSVLGTILIIVLSKYGVL